MTSTGISTGHGSLGSTRVLHTMTDPGAGEIERDPTQT